jgi:polyhydroxybutyrate depolymerase
MRSALVAVAAAIAASAALAAPPADRPGTLEVGGEVRRFTVHRPPASASARLPVVIALHGYGQPARSLAQMTGLSELGDRRGFEVVYPESESGGWNDGRGGQATDDIAFLGALIDELVGRGDVDPRRIYVTGFSNGAMLAFRAGCELADRVAAIAPVAGDLTATVAETCRPVRTPSVLVVEGSWDTLLAGGLGPRESAVFFARAAGCRAARSTRRSPRVIVVAYPGCRDRTVVRRLVLLRGGHDWPRGRELDASAEIWRFFERLSLG